MTDADWKIQLATLAEEAEAQRNNDWKMYEDYDYVRTPVDAVVEKRLIEQLKSDHKRVQRWTKVSYKHP